MRPPRLLALTGAAGLATAAGLHAAWATGSSWPATDRTRLADSVAGTPAMPEPSACWAVAATLAAAAGVTAGAGGQHQLAVLARAGVATALLARSHRSDRAHPPAGAVDAVPALRAPRPPGVRPHLRDTGNTHRHQPAALTFLYRT